MPLLKAIVAFARTLLDVVGWRIVPALTMMVLTGLTEGFGLLLLVPMLSMIGVNAGSEVVDRWSRLAASAIESLGAPVNLTSVLGAFVIVMTVRALLQRSEMSVMARLEYALAADIRRRLFVAVHRARWVALLDLRGSEIANALTRESDRAGRATAHFLNATAHASVGFVYLLLALRLSPTITLVAACGGILLLLLVRRRNAAVHSSGRELREASARLLDVAVEQVRGLKVIRSFGVAEQGLAQFAALSQRAASVAVRAEEQYAVQSVWFAVGSAVLLSVAVYVSREVLDLSTATILLLVVIFARIVPRLTAAQQEAQYFVHALPSFTSARVLIQTLEANVESERSDDLPLRLASALVLSNVSFRYPADAARTAVQDLNVTITARCTTALVGPSGAGKSTLADIIVGLLAPDAGTVTVDGQELLPSRMKTWRARIGYVPQDGFLFHDTVRENLLWVKPDASEAELWEALRLASADRFVARLPRALDTRVGDDGVLLSGGERQRLALARALLRRPQLLILDEATSALDSENETRIQEAIERLHGRMTILIITHRLATVRSADMLYVLEDGRAVEHGTWAQLWERRGRFRELCEAQGYFRGNAGALSPAGPSLGGVPATGQEPLLGR